MDYWAETMQDDCYLIAADGWKAETTRVIEKDKKGKDGKYNAKKGAKAIKTAKDAQDGKEKKKKLTKPDEAAVTALEQADAKMVDLEGDGVPFGKCMVTRKMTDELIKQPWFIFGRPGWPEEAQKSIAAGKRMGAILFQRLQVRNDPLVTKQTRLPQGGLDRRLLAQLGMNIEAVFQKSRVDQHRPAMLHLTLDASGSMYGRKWSKVRTVAVALAYVGSKMRNVDTVVSIRGGNELPIVSIVYDSRKDLFSRFTHFMANIGPAGATPEGLCFKATMEMILECADTHDVYFINFSDGEPAFGYSANTKFGVKAKRRSRFSSQPDAYYTYGGDVAAKHTRTMVQQMRELGLMEADRVALGRADAERRRVERGVLHARRREQRDLVDAGVDQDRARTRLGRVAVVLGDPALEFRRLHVVGVGGVWVRVDPVALVNRGPELDVTLHHHVQHALVLVGELVLVELAEAQAGLQHDVAGAWLQVAAQDLHERGLAAAVGADQAITVAVAEFNGDIFEQGLGPKLHGDIGGGDQNLFPEKGYCKKAAILYGFCNEFRKTFGMRWIRKPK